MRPTVLFLMKNIERRALLRSGAAWRKWAGPKPATQGCGELDHALQTARIYGPRVIVVDAEGFDGDGLHLLLKLRSECSDAKMIFMAKNLSASLCHMAHDAGARVIYGPGDDGMVLDRVQELLAEAPLARTMSGRVVDVIARDASSGDVPFGH